MRSSKKSLNKGFLLIGKSIHLILKHAHLDGFYHLPFKAIFEIAKTHPKAY